MTSYDLHARARRAMREGGFSPEFSTDAQHEADARAARYADIRARFPDVLDLRALPWSSIDNHDSRDLDQIEMAESLDGGVIRIRVGIADVASIVARGSTIDSAAYANSTSVYLGVETFPMLPGELSFGLTSLLPDADRLALVMQIDVAPDGNVTHCEVYRALVNNKAKLDYEGVGAWLENAGELPEPAQAPGIEAQLRLQDEAANRLLEARCKSGALDFETVEATPIVEAGRVVDLRVVHKNRARTLIENFMVAANGSLAGWLRAAGVLSLGRVVRRPQRWPRIVGLALQHGAKLPLEPDAPALSAFLQAQKLANPGGYADLSLSIVKLLGPGEYTVEAPDADDEGHFGLAVAHYAHATAPNRRYADLVVQRITGAVLDKTAPPYTRDELQAIADHCNQSESMAQKTERTMRKVAAAVLFGEKVGDVFDAIITGSSDKGVFARTLAPPVEGRIMRGPNLRGTDVGDHVRVRLVHTDPERGWIDFELV